ncbi:MAG: phosphate/phosphite/phosphonate ABC transporter substrate-binding protein [Thermodesulfobacteriota bacterium]
MRRTAFAVVACFLSVLMGSVAWGEIKIGMLAERGKEAAAFEWAELQSYLTEHVGQKVTVVPLKYSEFMAFVREEPAAIIFTNPWFFVRCQVRYHARALVTAKYEGSGAVSGGVIFAKKGSGIASLNDLRDRALMCPKFSSPDGWLFQKGEIEGCGLKPERDLKVLVESGKESDEEVVYAVREGKADAGTVRTNLLENMEREGKIRVDEFVILNQVQHNDFPAACSTPLYPEWPVAALGRTAAEDAARIKQALLSIPEGHPALKRAGRIEKFVEALDYFTMENLCRFLKVAPFTERHRQAQ